jgi:acyl-CoA thioester hydrolase
MACEFQITRRVEFSETDMAGIMHFSNYFRFMEAAEHAFFRSFGYSVVLSRNGLRVGLPRVHAQCDYRAPLHFEDEVLIHLLVEKKGRRSLTYQFRFLRLSQSPPLEVARGKLTVASAARQPDGSLKSVSLPKEIADRIEQAPSAMLAGKSEPGLAAALGPTSSQGPRALRRAGQTQPPRGSKPNSDALHTDALAPSI